MFYYAFLDENDICTQIYAMPAQISGSQFIAIASNDQSLIGKRFNRNTKEFEDVYYYASLDDRGVVESVSFYTSQQTTSATLLSITFAQYQTVTGLYWNGTEFVTPPISVLAVANTNEVSYKDEEKWLSAKLDEMDTATANNSSSIATIANDLTTVVTNLSTVSNSLSALATTVNGKANASHAHTAADISGVVKTVNGNAPDASGNITITNSGMTAAEILTALKTVDGTGSGVDADTLDGLDSTAFALANHTHDYLSSDALTGYATTANVTAALAGKSDTTHNHNTAYAPLVHEHTQYLTEDDVDLSGYATTAAMNTALAGKSNTSHNHDTAYAPLTHTHSNYATTASVTALGTTVNGKANATHTHAQSDITGLTTALNGKANSSHTHAQSDITGLSTALANKSDTSHNHDADYLSADGGTIGGNIDVEGVIRVNGSQMLSYSSGNAVIGTNNASGVTIGCATTGTVSVNGQYLRPYSILPRDNSSLCGNANFRWAGIYSQASVNVASDERLKEGIVYVDTDPLLEFVKRLKVADYKYIGSDENRIGLIAQDVISANPELAKYFVSMGEDGYYNLKPADFVFPLIAAVQELSRQLDELKN